MPTIPEPTNLIINQPSTVLRISPEIDVVNDMTETDAVVDWATWRSISLQLNGFGSATIEIDASKYDSTLDSQTQQHWPEMDPLSAFGINLGSNSGVRYYVSIVSIVDGEPNALFYGYITGATIDAATNTIAVECTSMEGLLDEIKISGMYRNYDLITEKCVWVDGPCRFNDPVDNRVYLDIDPENESYAGHDAIFWSIGRQTSNPWTINDILRYFEYVYTQVHEWDDPRVANPAETAEINSSAPRRIGYCVGKKGEIQNDDIFTTRLYSAIEDTSVGLSTIPRPYDATGKSLYEVFMDMFNYMNDVDFICYPLVAANRMRMALTASDAIGSVDLPWGERGDDASTNQIIEQISIGVNREQRIKKVVVLGAPTLCQMSVIYGVMTNGKLTNDLPDGDGGTVSSDIVYDRYIPMEQPLGSAYGPIMYAEPTATAEWITSSTVHEIFGTGRLPIYCDDRLMIAKTILSDDITKADGKQAKAKPKIWIFKDSWMSLSDYGLAVSIDDNYKISFTGPDDMIETFLEDIQNPDIYIIGLFGLYLQHRVRAVYGVKEDGTETSIESAIEVHSDDEVLTIMDPKIYDQVALTSFMPDEDGILSGELPNIGTGGTGWKRVGNAPETASTRAKSVFKKCSRNALNGDITLVGWRNLRPGQRVDSLTGGDRTIAVNTTIDSLTYDNNFSTTISLSRGDTEII